MDQHPHRHPQYNFNGSASIKSYYNCYNDKESDRESVYTIDGNRYINIYNEEQNYNGDGEDHCEDYQNDRFNAVDDNSDEKIYKSGQPIICSNQNFHVSEQRSISSMQNIEYDCSLANINPEQSSLKSVDERIPITGHSSLFRNICEDQGFSDKPDQSMFNSNCSDGNTYCYRNEYVVEGNKQNAYDSGGTVVEGHTYCSKDENIGINQNIFTAGGSPTNSNPQCSPTVLSSNLTVMTKSLNEHSFKGQINNFISNAINITNKQKAENVKKKDCDINESNQDMISQTDTSCSQFYEQKREYFDSNNCKTVYNSDLNYIRDSDCNDEDDTDDDKFEDDMDNSESGTLFSNISPNHDIQKSSDMIAVLSLLRDMCTAVEYTESIMEKPMKRLYRAISNTSTFSNSHDAIIQQKSAVDEFDHEYFNQEEYKKHRNKEYGEIESKEVRSDKDYDDWEQELSFGDYSEESDELSTNMKNISSLNNKKIRRGGNQRKNIRNVFSDKQLASTTQILREKEQERLRRLRLNRSLENTGKILQASATKMLNKGIRKKHAKPISNKMSKSKNKPSEVISLIDSDSDDSSVKPKSLSKEPILVLSSDSDEGDDDYDPVLDDLVQSEDYYSELGLHTNDALNICDSDGRILININHPEKDNDIFIPQSIANHLKPHQIGGIRFLYDNLIESVVNFRHEEGNGCILAHAMGLGKTIQTITFIDLYLRFTTACKVLCVVPVNTIQNWMNEFNRWLPANQDHFKLCNFFPKAKPATSKAKKLTKKAALKKMEADYAIVHELLEDMVDFVANKQIIDDVSEIIQQLVSDVCGDEKHLVEQDGRSMMVNVVHDGFRKFHVYLIDAQRSLIERAKIIEEWDKSGGVLLAGYEMYRSIAMYKVTNSKVKIKKGKKLVDENGDVLLRLKKAVCKPGPDLVVCDEGHRIRNYQSGISQALKSIKTRKRLVLTGYPLQNNLIEYWCMVDFVRPNYLGSRQEFSNMFERPIMNGQCVDSTPKDKHLMKQRAHVLYSLLQGFVQRRGHDVFNQILPRKEEHVLMIRMSPIQKALYNRLIEITRDAYNDSLNPIKTFSLCCKIWNHPDILYDAIRLSHMGKKVDIISDQDDIPLDDMGKPKRKRKAPLDMHNGMFEPYGMDSKDLLTDIVQWAGPIFKCYPYKLGSIGSSGKFFVLKQMLDQSLACDDKMLIFSQSLLTLNSIEMMLQKFYKSKDETNWRRGRDYYRLDGSTSTNERERLIRSFNDVDNKEVKLFVLSTRAGCLGINLVAANRVVVFDVSWNPCHDAQAVCRIYRYGQTKPCYIYRLVSSNTMEKKIYYRQISKQGISDRVVDEMNLTENFSRNEIQSLVIEDWVDEPFLDFTNACYLFDDPVLIYTLQSCSQWITKIPFKHESLLINESASKLSGSEKRAAKREYEQERMMSQGSAPLRTYPLQRNFPRDSPIAPVRPFLWRPPLNPPSWLKSPLSAFQHTISHTVTIPSTFQSFDPLQILRQDAFHSNHSYAEVDRMNDGNNYWNLEEPLQSAFSASSNGDLNTKTLPTVFDVTSRSNALTSDINDATALSNSILTSSSVNCNNVNEVSRLQNPCLPNEGSFANKNTFACRPGEKSRIESANLSQNADLNFDQESLYTEEQETCFEGSNDSLEYMQSQKSSVEVIVLDDD